MAKPSDWKWPPPPDACPCLLTAPTSARVYEDAQGIRHVSTWGEKGRQRCLQGTLFDVPSYTYCRVCGSEGLNWIPGSKCCYCDCETTWEPWRRLGVCFLCKTEFPCECSEEFQSLITDMLDKEYDDILP